MKITECRIAKGFRQVDFPLRKLTPLLKAVEYTYQEEIPGKFAGLQKP